MRVLPPTGAGWNAVTINPGSSSNATLSTMGAGLTIKDAHLNFYNPNNTAWKNQIRFYGGTGERHLIIDEGCLTFDTQIGVNNGNGTTNLVKFTGALMVGNTNLTMPAGYKLYVKDGILTEKVKVAVYGSASWPDYVFADSYELPTLYQVEKYINENKHLPNVPSAEEIVSTGIDMATMDAKLLEKIEELTLYSIQLKKEIDDLKAIIDEIR